MTVYKIMIKYSINKLLKCPNNESPSAFLCSLKIAKDKDNKLKTLRDIAREGIIKKWSDAKDEVKKDEKLYKRISEASMEKFVKLKPRFKMQGSYVYGTIVTPAHPSQEIDLDDGMYIPMSVVMQDDKTMSSAMFEVVDKVLSKMASKQGWRQVSKHTCSRLQTDEGIHLDIPCYAIPDEDFSRLSINESKVGLESFSLDSKLDINTVNLALRNGDWIESNPQHIHEWVIAAKQEHVYFQDIVKIVKGMRDHNYISKGPSSISLMVAVENIMSSSSKLGSLTQELQNVVQQLPNIISKQLNHPHPDSQHLIIHDPSELEKLELRNEFERFKSILNFALIDAATEREAMDALIKLFGSRMPDDQSRIVRINNSKHDVPPTQTKFATPVQEHNTFG